jgi:hypothetical protein
LSAQKRAEFLEKFVADKIVQFKGSPTRRIKDMGTVMHLILRTEINQLKDLANSK